MAFTARRRSAVVLASILALAAGPLMVATTAGATVFDSISSIVDPVGDTAEVRPLLDLGLEGPTDRPRADITAASVRYQNGNVTFTMKLVQGIDLANTDDQLFWTVSQNFQDSPQFHVSIMRGANLFGEAVVKQGFPEDNNPPINCPGSGAAFDVVSGSYSVSVPATCIGSIVSFHWGAFSRVHPAGMERYYEDFGPDDAFAEAAIPATVSGYWAVGSDGKVYDFGDAPVMGQPATANMVDIEASRFGKGYWTLDEKGIVSAFGNNGWSDGHPGPLHYGSIPAGQLKTGERAVSLSGTPTGAGYWVFTNTGRNFPFGDANKNLGDFSTTKFNGEILDSAATPSGNGYYLVGSDGGVFTSPAGDAVFQGSTGDIKLNRPVQSIVPDPDGVGYWLVADDGGVFTFQSVFRGSTGNITLNKPMTGMVPFGNGYLMVAQDGGVFNFSDKAFSGSLGNNPPANPIVSITALS